MPAGGPLGARKPADRRGSDGGTGVAVLQAVPMLAQLLTLALLATGPDAQALRRELDAVAGRIEQLKARRLAGESVQGELNGLLVRSQELAEELERTAPHAASPAAAPQVEEDREGEEAAQLRDRASSLRVQADRLVHRIALVEARIGAVLRSATAPRPAGRAREPSASYASLTDHHGNATAAPAPTPPALAALVEQRAQLVVQVEQLEREAEALDAAAEELEKD